MWQTLLGPLADIADTVLKRVLPAEKMSEAEREQFKAQFQVALMSAERERMETAMSAIIAEAKSADPFTSRARPGFLYVIYALILFGIPMGILSAFQPEIAARIAEGFRAWLAAVPEFLWGVFGTGYLGYTMAREYGKGQILKARKA